MRKFIVTTESESGDDYVYLIKSNHELSYEELDEWLSQNCNDRDEEDCYEFIVEVLEIKEEDFKELN